VARGEYFARLESDDVWLPRKLEQQIEFMERTGNERIGVCGSDVFLVNSTGSIITCKRFPRTNEECVSAIWYRNPLCHSTIIGRTAVLQTTRGYDESKFLVEDLDLWFRVMEHWQIANVPVPLVRYRIWENT